MRECRRFVSEDTVVMIVQFICFKVGVCGMY